MKKFNFKGCDINITNESNYVSEDQCVRFLLTYTSHWLADEILAHDGYVWTPDEITDGTTLNMIVKDVKNMISIFINDKLHIEITPNEYHNAQLMCDQNGVVHGSFFERLHNIKCNGSDLMSY